MYVVSGSGFFVWRIFLSIGLLFAMRRVVTTFVCHADAKTVPSSPPVRCDGVYFATPYTRIIAYVGDLSCDCAAGMPHLLQKSECHEMLVKTDKLFRFG